MEIEFLQDYCFIQKGRKYKLQNFTVLTGRNGAGKTKLLEGIIRGENCKIDGNPRISVNIDFFNFSHFYHSISDKEFNVYSQNDSLQNGVWQRYKLFKNGNGEINQNIEEVARYVGKDILQLTKADFKAYPVRRNDERIKIFGLNFFEDSAIYISHIEKNKFNAFRNHEFEEEDNLVYTKEEFEKVFGIPPWQRINQIFKDMGLNYRFKIPNQTKRKESIKVQMVDNVNNQEVEVNGLSSGERTILSIASFIYNSEIKENIPDLFLFDEPDALLHPEYSKKLISILNDYLVKKLGKLVIITTHSPSTVAIVPEESIFICEKKSFQIRKATKDEALQQLTFNVTSLSISHENRRQVFVEDKMDAKVFESIFQKIKNEIHPEISLNFIPISTSGTGGCSKVKSITKALNQAGNKSVYGIIDWDSENKTNGNILVLGENERDSIENYILDPVLIYAFLLWAKKVPFKKLSFDFEHSYMNFNSLNSNNLQEISDKVLFLLKKLKPKDSKDGIKSIEYLNGKQISLPIWYLEIDGHDLEKGIEKEFPEIIKFKKREEAKLVELIVETVLVDLPEFIPIDFVELFKKIQIGK
ncbi:MAG: AAA family ATPase [Saprospiraceae bacterium]